MSAPAGSALVVFLLAAAAGIWLSFTPPTLPPFQVVALTLPEPALASSVTTVSSPPEFNADKAPLAAPASLPAGDETSVADQPTVAEASIDLAALPPADVAPDSVIAETLASVEAPEPIAAVEPDPVIVEQPAPVAESEPLEPDPVIVEQPAPVAESEPLEPDPVVAREPEPVEPSGPDPEGVVEQPAPVAESEPVDPQPDVAGAPEPVVEPEPVVAEAPEPVVEPEPMVAETPEPVAANETPTISDGSEAAAGDAEPFSVAALSPDEVEAAAEPEPVAPKIEPQPEAEPEADIAPRPEPEASTVPEAPAEPAAEPAPVAPGETWLAYARPFDDDQDRPRIAIVVAGLGLGPAATLAAIQLPGAITLAFSSHARDLQQWIDLARAAGHEVMLDLPMEPLGYPAIDPGPQALLTTLPSAENVARLKWHLGRASGYVGVTHTMGSRFTASPDDLRPVLSALKVRGLMFLDARTSSSSVAARLAATIGLPRAINDRFLDTQASRPAIDRRLGEIEAIALANGFAVAVSHPFPVTLERLGHWVATLDEEQFVLAPISALVNRQAVR